MYRLVEKRIKSPKKFINTWNLSPSKHEEYRINFVKDRSVFLTVLRLETIRSRCWDSILVEYLTSWFIENYVLAVTSGGIRHKGAF